MPALGIRGTYAPSTTRATTATSAVASTANTTLAILVRIRVSDLNCACSALAETSLAGIGYLLVV